MERSRHEARLQRARPARRALSADAALIAKLDDEFRGRVHSTFERVINIEIDGGELVSLASRDLDNAPDTLVVDIEGFGRSGIELHDPALTVGGTLRVGPLDVRFDEVSGWCEALPAWPSDVAAPAANLRRIEAALEHTEDADRRPGPKDAGGSFADEARTVLKRRTELLRDALLRRDVDGACAQAGAMVGLGQGLTPSGDDFLVGLFAVLHVPGSPCHAMRTLCGNVAAAARSSTNAISYAALANAARGRVRESILALVRELAGAVPSNLPAAIERVLAIGSTSGREIAAGVAFGLALNLEIGRESSCR